MGTIIGLKIWINKKFYYKIFVTNNIPNEKQTHRNEEGREMTQDPSKRKNYLL